MSTLSLQEMNQINMVVSFIDLISKPLEVESFGEANSVEHDKSVLYNASLLCKGGFPLNYINDFDEKTCIEKNRDYITQLCSGYKKTNADYASFKFNKNTMFKVVNAISRRIMQEYNIDSIAFESDIDHKTCVRYLDILKNMYIIDEFYPFKPHIFSNPKKTPKIFIFDPCFAVAALNTNSQELVNNVQIYIDNKRNNKDDFGFFFEAQVIKQLKLFAELSDANIGFFTNKDFEIDCIIEYKNHMSLYEIKTGSFLSIKDGIEAIKRFKKLLTPEQLARVTTANIITAGNHMYYDEESAVNIIPIKYLFFPTDSKT
jgi:predicted AAA+ superfamily ATPase